MKKKKVRRLDSYLTGGSPETMLAQTISSGLMNLIDVLGNDPNKIDQPIVNATTARTMISPYAMGGDVDEATLQQFADDSGLTIDELVQQLGLNGEEDSIDILGDGNQTEGEYASGGWIKGAVNPAHKGYCTPMTKSTCTGHRKALAKTFKKHHGFHKKAYGGTAKSNIEVEDDEVLQLPSGKTFKMNGDTHEEGGIDVSVPKGTKIYSDRLKVDGKSMQERKLARERKLGKLNKLIIRNPQDKLLKASLKRTTENVSLEEDRDMAIQKVANKIYNSPKYAFGGEDGDPRLPFFDKTGTHFPNFNLDVFDPLQSTQTPNLPNPNDSLAYTNTVPNVGITGARGVGTPQPIPTVEGTGVGLGDILGIAGNVFNTVAPTLNTLANRRATKPNINRFRGFGRKAIEANDQAQGYVAGVKANALADVDTAANSSYLRNNNSTSSVGTNRALNTVTDIVRGKAKNSIDDTFSKEMMQILSQRSQLENEKDLREMSGETSRDLENKGDIDSFYSNMAANIINAGVNVQGLGKNIGQIKTNKVNKKLISQLSKYGLTFDDDGKLISGK